LCGFEGWLLTFSILIPLGVLFVAGQNGLGLSSSSANIETFNKLDVLVPWASKANDTVLLISDVAALLMAVLWFGRVRAYRFIWVGVFALNLTVPALLWLIIAMCADAAAPGFLGDFMEKFVPAMMVNSSASLILALPFLGYLFRSRRFRVNFEHKVLYSEQAATRPSLTEQIASVGAPG
jgi:hypothetical protein